jgi:hypothetical protein
LGQLLQERGQPNETFHQVRVALFYLVETLVRPDLHTGDSSPEESADRLSLVLELANILRIAQSEDDPCPTRRHVSIQNKTIDKALQAYATLERAAIDIVPTQLAYRHCGIFVRVHLNESEAAIGLESSFDNISEILKQRNEIRLGRIRSKVADVARRLPLGSLREDHFVTLNSMLGKAVMAIRSRRCHSHGRHSLLLGYRRLAFLVGPVATDCTRSQPFTVHGRERAFGVGALTERHKAIASRATGFHIPHDARFGDRTEGRECLKQDLIIDLIGQVADENVEMATGVLLVGIAGLVRPVDADFLPRSACSLQFRHIRVRLTD